MLARMHEQRQISASEREQSTGGHNKARIQNDCQRNCHSTGFVVINYSPSDWHTCVQRDPPRIIEKAEFKLTPTVTSLTSPAFAPSSSILVVPGLTFQQDNVRPYMARIAMNCLQACPILPGQARSPELSCIENISDVMGKRLQPSRSVDDLCQHLGTIRNEHLQDTIR
ncbi:transposable element Tcb1 transposase [Trichonephila clavipes]|nr:transposable element Tcb1 transposase [Trichonephila clavipes]